jgi:hypothetical protein
MAAMAAVPSVPEARSIRRTVSAFTRGLGRLPALPASSAVTAKP